MMNYEEFKKEVESRFTSFIPDEYLECKVYVRPIQRNNCIMDCLSVMVGNIAPTIYLNEMYESYKKIGRFDEIMAKAGDIYLQAIKNVPSIDGSISEPSYIRENVCMQLVNYDKNKKRLQDVPHIKFLDLAIIFRVVISKDKDGVSSYILNNQLVEQIGIDTSELLEIAERNTKDKFPSVVKNISDIMKSMGVCDDSLDLSNGPEMIIATNENSFNGAIFMTFTDELKMLADSIGSDLYIIPSSIHEVIILPDNDAPDIETIKNSILDANGTLETYEFLSDNLYKFNRSEGAVAIVSLIGGGCHE